MTDRKQMKRNIRQLQRIKTWQLLVLLVLVGFVVATFLRLNNIGMVQRREAVASADLAGDNEITQTRLFDLQRYVSAHMNTDMGKGIYLEEGYKRDVQNAYNRAAADTNPNGNIYKKAQDVCAPQFSSWSYAYIQCTTDELAKYPASSNLDSVKLPQADAYLHVFVSPLWSPDFAGWSVLVFGVIALMIIVRFASIGLLKLLLRRHYKNI
ncbi:MAG: hypothetical protein WCI79_00695 [Candidatus Saccharibacteria bacterium]